MMTLQEISSTIHNGLVVSCHIDDGIDNDTLFTWMVRAALSGGASALRVEGVEHVRLARGLTDLPLIGFTQGSYPDGGMLITPELDHIDALFSAGANVVAIDVTKRRRPDGIDGFVFFEQARKRVSGLLWADIANFREGVRAAEIGANFVATTLCGHTPGTATDDYRTPDYQLIRELSHTLTIPVIAEGRIWTPEAAVHALHEGAHAVVVGSAITRPRIITTTFVSAMREFSESNTH
jgi:N-acylglucosamine-6-phosphate 2-epimerase